MQEVVKLIDSYTGEVTSYYPITEFEGGGVVTDADVDGVIIRKKGDTYYKRAFTGPVNVKWFGAKGDGVTDDTAAINKCLRAARNVAITEGIYMINCSNSDSGVQALSNSIITFEKDAIFKAITTSATGYNILQIFDCYNVKVINPIIIGDRDTHIVIDPNNKGEWGHGINIINSQKISIVSPQVSNCWGDGIYIGNKYDFPTYSYISKDISISNAHIDNTRRNGISVASCADVLIDGGVIKNINGTAPEAGIDIEPEGRNGAPVILNNIIIQNITTINCKQAGIGAICTQIDSAASPISSVSIVNHQDDNSLYGLAIYGSPSQSISGRFLVKSPFYKNNKYSGVLIQNYSAVNTPKIEIDEAHIENWNTADLPQTQQEANAILLIDKNYEVGTLIFGNVSISSPVIVGGVNNGNTYPLYLYCKNTKDISLLNAKQIIGCYGRLSINTQTPGIFLSDIEKCLFRKNGFFYADVTAQDINRYNYMRFYSNAGAQAAWTYKLDSSILKGMVVTIFIESAFSVTILSEAGVPISPLPNNTTQLVSRDIGSFVTLQRTEQGWQIIERSGEWNLSDIFIKNISYGSTVNRPVLPANIVTTYFDTTLSKPIYWTGNTWVDATGTTV